MTQRGIYAAPCDVRPNRDRKVDCAEEKEQKLWILEFKVKGIGKGCAVVKASNPKEAVVLLTTSGVFNGLPYLYKVVRVEEIIPSPDSMLLAEQVVTYKFEG